MGRAERRRAERNAQKKVKTYNLTEEALQKAIKDRVENEFQQIKAEATKEAIDTVLLLTLALPLEVLKDHYWKKSYAKRLPKFTDRLLEYYQKWQNGELSTQELEKDLWELGRVRMEESNE